MKIFRQLKSNPKFNPIMLGLFALIAGIAGYFIITSEAAPPPPPTIYLTPSSQTFAVNTTFSIQVRENSGATAVNAVQANFSYNASLLDFVSIDTTGSAFTTDAPSSGGSGQVSIARGIVGNLTGDQLVATVNFRTKTTSGAAAMAFTSGTALVNSTTNTDILGSLAATAGGTYTVDATPPTVSVSAPANGATLNAGSTVTITATASDNSSVSSVDILVDGLVKTSLTASPYNYSWNTTGLAFGPHTIQARAFDPYGNSTSSSIITVTLADLVAPTASITSPTAGSNVRSTVTVNVTAADNAGGTGISKVEFYVDAVLIATDTTSPYSFSWNTISALNGSRSLTARAYDGATPANIGISPAIAVIVDNQLPTTPTSLRTTNVALTSVALAWNASTDNTAVTGYRVQRNGATIATVTTLLYSDTGLTAGTSYTYTVAALDAAGNVSTPASLTVSTLTPKRGDLNGDNLVNVTDLSILLSNWNTSNAVADINADGTVNIFDLSILLSNYGT